MKKKIFITILLIISIIFNLYLIVEKSKFQTSTFATLWKEMMNMNASIQGNLEGLKLIQRQGFINRADIEFIMENNWDIIDSLNNIERISLYIDTEEPYVTNEYSGKILQGINLYFNRVNRELDPRSEGKNLDEEILKRVEGLISVFEKYSGLMQEYGIANLDKPEDVKNVDWREMLSRFHELSKEIYFSEPSVHP